MTIETKYNPHQWVWILRDGKARKVQIQTLEAFSASGDRAIIEYWVEVVNIPGNKLREEQIYESQEALLASIMTTSDDENVARWAR